MKDIFKIRGKITVKETGLGIENVVVHVLDVDFSKSNQASSSVEQNLDNSLLYDSIGSVFTDDKGNFELEYNQNDFNSENNEDVRPELVLYVTRPEDSDESKATFSSRVLYASKNMRLKAGKIESFHIRIPEKVLDQYHLNPGSATSLLQKSDSKRAKNKMLLEAKKVIHSAIKSKVEDAFSSFSFSKLPISVQTSMYFYKPGDNLESKQQSIIDNKLASLSRVDLSNIAKEITISFSEMELRSLGLWDDATRQPRSGSIPKKTIEAIVQQNSLVSQTLNTCLKQFTEDDLSPITTSPTPVDNSEAIEGISTTITEQIQKQLTSATSPETALKYEKVIDANSKNNNLCESVNQLALCGGPADVTAYHDFQSLEIAFEHVWTELFDNEILTDGKALYEEFLKIDDGIRSFEYYDHDGRLLEYSTRIESTDDLRKLVNEFAKVKDASGRIIDKYDNNSTIMNIITRIYQRLSSSYKFSIFAPNSINYGVMYTYRQKWEPRNYQVGKLISSLPLAPKEIRKYNTKRVTTKSKNEKYLEDREFKGKKDSNSTSRAESEIIKRAQQNTSFGLNSTVSIDLPVIDASITNNLNNTSEKFSQDTKKNFREAVLNATEEYRNQNKTEIEFGYKDDYTTESSGEISNPNDEITVTYLFYELQRQYDISEFLHKITPVVLVANEVPTPAEIDVDWLLANAWILKRIILDESFLPALQNLMNSPIGDTMAIDNLKRALEKQEAMVDSLQQQVDLKKNILHQLNERIKNIAYAPDASLSSMDQFNIVRAIFDPIGSLLTNAASSEDKPTQAERINEYLTNTLEKTEKEQAILISSLKQEQSILQQIIEKFNTETREFFDKQTAITQLKIHIKENILYYMQRIWDYEPDDQRFFRLYNLEINWFEEESVEETVEILTFEPRPFGRYSTKVKLKNIIRNTPVKRKLIEVADLDKLLGYKGNYMIFPVKEISYLHAYMMQEFIDNSTNGIKDADDFANYTTQDLIDYLKCVKSNNPESFEAEKDFIIRLINERLNSTRKEKERIIIPTNSVYIEALPGKHPIMEDFKLAHRALDVKKVQAEVRQAELENLRLAARLLEGEREDPNIEKIVVKK